MAVSALAWTIAAVTLTIASVFDIRSRRIPNWLTGGAFVAGLVIAQTQSTLAYAVVSASLSMLVMWLPNLFRSGVNGTGDIKLVGAVGVLLGVASTLIAVGAATFGALAFLAASRESPSTWNHPSGIPFAPFILAGS